MTSILWNLPYNIHTLNTDSGSEFVNSTFKDLIVDTRGINLTRSRPYRKNDNAYVEQQNFIHVRELFGYERFDKYELIYIMNQIYTDYFNVFHNFFIPQLKSVEVTRVGSQYKREYGKPKTPYQRLVESDYLSNYEKQVLKDKYESLTLLS